MKLIPRNKYIKRIIPFIDKEIIKVIVGQRRVGKSYMLKLLQEEIIKRNESANIVSINKELYEFEAIRTAKDLYKFVIPLLKKENNYLFIDEIQDIINFENTLRDFFARGNIDIYISGSNSRLLSGEIATYLSGRYIEFKINTLSYDEFLLFHNLEHSIETFNKYIKFGGMPYLRNLILEDEVVNQYLKSIYDTIILKDIVARYNIRNVDLLIKLTDYIADNIGNILSAKKISDYLKSQKINFPVNTIISYLGYLVNSFIVEKIQRADIIGKKIFEINEKFFFQDLGIRNTLVGFRPQDISKLLENLIYNHLKYLGYDIKIGVLNNCEVDFVATSKDEKKYFQVCYMLTDKKVIKREFENLLAIPDNYEKIVLSMDEFTLDDYKGIKHYNILKYLEESI